MVDAEYVFEPTAVHKTEIVVLNALRWRMQAVTAFSFIDHYLHKFSDGDAVSKIILARSVELILSASKGIILNIIVCPLALDQQYTMVINS